MTRLLGTAAAIVILGAGLSGVALAQYQAYQPNPYLGQPQYGTSSYQYPPGPGGQWQQSYQLGARPEISGTVSAPPGVATSSGSTMPNPAYMPSAAQYGTDGGTYVPYGHYGR
jgi:hypothetical protein